MLAAHPPSLRQLPAHVEEFTRALTPCRLYIVFVHLVKSYIVLLLLYKIRTPRRLEN